MNKTKIFFFIFSLFLMILACNLPKSSTDPITPQPQPFNPNILGDGELRFVTDEAVSSEAGHKPVHGCWPSSYYDDGLGYLDFRASILDGGCRWISPSDVNPQVTWNTEGSLSGHYELTTGLVVFQFETKAEYPFSSIISLTFDGTGFFTTPTHAEGTATFTSICQSIGDEDHCGSGPNATNSTRTSWEITGNVPWTMDFAILELTPVPNPGN